MSNQRKSLTPSTGRPSTSSRPPTRQSIGPILVPVVPKKKEPFNLAKFEQDCLDEHNRLRALHGCQPLKLNRVICKYATEWAENLARRNAMEHRSNSKYGENIFKSSGYAVCGKFPVTKWYGEIEQYDFRQPAFKPEVGHFTQVIWKKTKNLGVGLARKTDSVWVVANYDPPGNVLNEFEENVPKLKS